MVKDKNYNPVAAQRKADKAKAIKKGKAEVQEKRNERLARKNPLQIQSQIDKLKNITDGGGKLSRHEELVLQGLDKELKAVNKARDALGHRAPALGRAWHRDGDSKSAGVLGKRRRLSQDVSTSDEDVPDDVNKIPMPRDTPPPIPKAVVDEWYAKRRAQRNVQQANHPRGISKPHDDIDANKEKPAVEARTVYEAAPVTRNLQKEAVSAFVPSAVRSKLDKSSGQGALMEPEQVDALEQQGYLAPSSKQTQTQSPHQSIRPNVTVEDADDGDE